MSNAVKFEYEWMADDSLRLRFIDADNGIVGQQSVATDGLLALQILVGLAVARATNIEPEKLGGMLRYVGIDGDLAMAKALLKSVRARASLTPEGNIELHVVEGSDM